MNQVRAGVVLNYVIIGLNILVGLLYTPYMLRCLGQKEYGLYSLVASVITYLTVLDFGFGNAIIRYTAKFRAENKRQEQWEMFGMFLISYSLIGLIALSIGLGLYLNVDLLFDKTMTNVELEQARIMLLLLTFNLTVTFPLSIFGSIISAYENFVFQRIINIARIILSTITMICLLSIGYKAISLVITTTTFNILTLVINYVYCKQKLGIQILFGHIKWSFFKEISAYSFWIFLNAIVERIYWGTGQFVLGTLVGSVAVAIFSVAILLQQMYIQFSAAISSVLLPKITTMVSQNQENVKFTNIFISTGRIQAHVLFLIICVFIVFGKTFIELWAGEGYEQSYIITAIFFLSLFIPLIQNTGVIILQARNDLKFRSISYVIISILSLIAQIVLTKYYGSVGCAIAIGGGLLLGQGLVMNWYYQAKQGLDIQRFWKEIIRISIFPVVLTVVATVVLRLIDSTSFFVFCLSICCFVVMYIAAMWKWSMNPYEHDLFFKLLIKLHKNNNSLEC